MGSTEVYCHLRSKCRRTKDLKLGQGQKVNIYTDSCYAFATTHVHGTMYKERGSLKDYQKYNKFCSFLKLYKNPRKWPSYIFQSVRRDMGLFPCLTNLADKTSQEAEIKTSLIMASILVDQDTLPYLKLPNTPERTQPD